MKNLIPLLMILTPVLAAQADETQTFEFKTKSHQISCSMLQGCQPGDKSIFCRGEVFFEATEKRYPTSIKLEAGNVYNIRPALDLGVSYLPAITFKDSHCSEFTDITQANTTLTGRGKKTTVIDGYKADFLGDCRLHGRTSVELTIDTSVRSYVFNGEGHFSHAADPKLCGL